MNVNVRAAAVHVVGDLISSVGVLIASIIIMVNPKLTVVDPICTFIFSAFVLATTYPLMWSSLAVLMEGTPPHLTISTVMEALKAMPGVQDVHDLHLWAISQGKTVLTVHLIMSPEFAMTSSPEKPVHDHDHHDHHSHDHEHSHEHEHEHEHSTEEIEHSRPHSHSKSNDSPVNSTLITFSPASPQVSSIDLKQPMSPSTSLPPSPTTMSTTPATTSISSPQGSAHQRLLISAQHLLCKKFDIHHATIQIEVGKVASSHDNEDEEDDEDDTFE
ncbi:hypothetical protein HDU76_000346, partial [Blyttiomyces sp. JEL0837]